MLILRESLRIFGPYGFENGNKNEPKEGRGNCKIPGAEEC